MTLVAIPRLELEYPSGVRYAQNAPGSVSIPPDNVLLDAADEACCQVCIAPKAGNIDRIKFRTNTVTTGATLNVALEAIGSNGMPAFAKSLFATNTEGSSVVAASDDNVWKEVTLTAAATVTRDQMFAIVLRNPSGSPGNMNIAMRPSPGNTPIFGSSSSRVRACTALGSPPTVFSDTNMNHLMVAFRYDDATWWRAPGTFVYGTGATNFMSSGSSSTTNRRGNRFQVPFSCKLGGAWAHVSTMSANSDFYIKLYNDAGTELASSGLVDGDHMAATSTDDWVPAYLTSEYTLAINTWYRIAVVPSAAVSMAVTSVDFENADIAAASLGTANFYRSLYTSGAWVDTTTSMENVIPILSALDDGAGGAGGGLLVHPGMNGGMRG